MHLVKKYSFLLMVGALLFSHSSMGQFWSVAQKKEGAKPEIQPRIYETYQLDEAYLSRLLSKIDKGIATPISLPLPDGGEMTFLLEVANTMHPALAAKFPEIRAYSGKSIKGNATLRLDLTEKGFHAMILSPEGTIYFDPFSQENTNQFIVYDKKEFMVVTQKEAKTSAPRHRCLMPGHEHIHPKSPTAAKKVAAKSNGTELRQYRLAVTTTGEYTQFHGGTVSEALSAIVTTVNRINGIFEREVAITLQLVADNDQLIFTNSSTDGFTNDDASSFIDEAHDEITRIIGSANFDIGHGFSTGAGGLASLGSVCNDFSKGAGVTGTSNPIGDPFDVDFVAHEIGHQFAAEHTFNGNDGSCSGLNREGSSAYEPGSGSTIMAYAGICGSVNIQDRSDDYFHTHSYDQVVDFSTSGRGNTCATISQTGNTPPTVSVPEGGFTIPKETPFELTGSATDPEESTFTYCWEQHDLGPAGHPNSPGATSPIFRSFAPTTSPTRTFPQLNDILLGTQTIGEILPEVSRSMEFRLTVRDNAEFGGVNYESVSFDVTANAGPFDVTSQSSATTYTGGDEISITWDVAGTFSAPVSCSFVDIFLSTNGGLTFETTLASSETNDGSAIVTLPNVASSNCRIKVKASDNIFFDINESEFTIEEATVPDFFLAVDASSLSICGEAQATYSFTVTSIAGFNESINLSSSGIPSGATIDISPSNLLGSGTFEVTLGNLTTLDVANYSFEILATSSTVSHDQTLGLVVGGNLPDTASLSLPEQGAVEVSTQPEFSWIALPNATSYALEIASDEQFQNIVIEEQGIATNSYSATNLLSPKTDYYWRVKGENGCGEGDYSRTFSFTTADNGCLRYTSADTPITIGDGLANTINSITTSNAPGTVTDVNILELRGTHSYISDLEAVLMSPEGTEVRLFWWPCDDEEDFHLMLDDAGSSYSNIPCPPVDLVTTYQPYGFLSDFNDESAAGEWNLQIEDGFFNDGGSLDFWEIEICTSEIIGLDERVVQGFLSLSPNPTSTTLEITLHEISSSADVLVLDPLGKVMQRGDMKHQGIHTSSTQLDISQLPQGVYHIQVQSNQGVWTSSFSKQ